MYSACGAIAEVQIDYISNYQKVVIDKMKNLIVQILMSVYLISFANQY